MLTGTKLGQAIAQAIVMKGVSKAQVARDFGVKPPSVQGWIDTGRIDKDKLTDLWRYFSDVVGPTHWGLRGDELSSRGVAVMEAPAPQYQHNEPPGDDSEIFARMLALQAGLLAIIRAIPYAPNLPPVLEHELARARDIMAANPIDEQSLSAFDNQAEAIRLSADIHHSRRS